MVESDEQIASVILLYKYINIYIYMCVSYFVYEIKLFVCGLSYLISIVISLFIASNKVAIFFNDNDSVSEKGRM